MTTTILPERRSDPQRSPDSTRPQTSGTDRRPAATPASGAAPRTDIQALRALAVTLVLVYHLWPGWLTGGFVGVDVFFVVSGFLITAHLAARPPRTPRDFGAFWARRIRRLLPASLLVLAVTLLASRLVAPESQWANIAQQVAASAGYVENWVLAGNSVDYLAAEAAATPVQHFWSLSVEEQFYFVWPFLIAGLTVLAVRRRRPNAVLLGLAVLVGASLLASIVVTVLAPTQAYFLTPIRAWEFGLGGLLAVLVARRAGAPAGRSGVRLTKLGRVVLAAIGFAAIGYAALAFSADTPFPGWWALVPTLGAVAVLAAVPTSEVGPLGRVLALRPVQWLGDVSYSVYLWHWPLIVLLPYALGRPLGPLLAVAILPLTLLLAALTKRFVEDRFRYPRRLPRRGTGLLRVFLAAALGMALVLGLAVAQLAEVGRSSASAEVRVEAALATDNPCFGAGSLYRPKSCADVTFEGMLPTPALAPRDRSALHPDVSRKPTCWSDGPDFPVLACQFGDPNAKRQLALVGNSHAGQWLPALQEIAGRKGWGITTFVAARCAMVPVSQQLATGALTTACNGWVEKVTAKIEQSDFDLVVLANRMARGVVGAANPAESLASYQQAYEKLLTRWDAAGVRTLALQDTPAPGDAGLGSIPDCVGANPTDLDRCSGDPQSWIPEEPLIGAVQQVDSKRIKLANLNRFICEPELCRPVVGGVLAYYDEQHLTATFARTLADPLAAKLAKSAKWA